MLNQSLLKPLFSVVLGFSLMSAFNAHAARTWLLPSTFTLSAQDELVLVDAGNAEDLFRFRRQLPLNQLEISTPSGEIIKPSAIISSKLRNSAEIALKENGSYRISQQQTSFLASYSVNGETKRWRGDSQADLQKAIPSDAQNLKVTRNLNRNESFISKDRAEPMKWANHVDSQGLSLEPISRVTELNTGDKTHLRLMLNGKPLANAELSLIRGNNRHRYKLGEVVLKTDSQGEFSIQWKEAGVYWLGISYKDESKSDDQNDVLGSPNNPNLTFDYSATFEVLPE